MTLEHILHAAVHSMIQGHHSPHCFSAHVPGHGYVNDGTNPETRADYLRQLERTAISEIENLGYANGYAEPGYHDPDKGVVFANWNVFPKGLDRVLEHYGYAIEWSDEWSTCDGCNKAVRTSADSYGWQPSYVMDDSGINCLACVDYADYLETLEDDPNACCMAACDPSDYGYVRIGDRHAYESGFHPGQTDDPAAILKALHAEGYAGIVFRLSETSQFYVRFEAWHKPEDTTEAD